MHINSQNCDERTALHVALAYDYYPVPVCKYLIDQGADILLQDVYGLSCLDYAVSHAVLVAYMVAKVEKEKIEQYAAMSSVYSKIEQCSLHCIHLDGELFTIVDCTAWIARTLFQMCKHALSQAIQTLITQLVVSNTTVDITLLLDNCTDDNGNSCIQILVACHSMEVLRAEILDLLLSFTPNLHHLNMHGKTALDMAKQSDLPMCVAKLQTAGESCNIQHRAKRQRIK